MEAAALSRSDIETLLFHITEDGALKVLERPEHRGAQIKILCDCC